MKYCYTVVLDKDTEEGGYTVTVPALPGCITEGDTVEESLEMVKDVIAGYLEALSFLGKTPDPDVDEVRIEVTDTEEILIYKVAVELEMDVVQAAQGPR